MLFLNSTSGGFLPPLPPPVVVAPMLSVVPLSRLATLSRLICTTDVVYSAAKGGTLIPRGYVLWKESGPVLRE